MRLGHAGPDASIRAAHAVACVSMYSRIVASLPSRILMPRTQWSSNGLFVALIFPSRRRGELKRPVEGVSDKVLIQPLNDLEADREQARTSYNEVPPRVDHAPTPLGRGLADAIIPLCT